MVVATAGDTNEAMDSRTTVDADTRRKAAKPQKVTLMVDDVPVAQVCRRWLNRRS